MVSPFFCLSTPINSHKFARNNRQSLKAKAKANPNSNSDPDPDPDPVDYQSLTPHTEAGLLKPYNYVSGYTRLSNWMERNVSPESKRSILEPLSVLRPKFRAIAQNLTDMVGFFLSSLVPPSSDHQKLILIHSFTGLSLNRRSLRTSSPRLRPRFLSHGNSSMSLATNGGDI